MTFDLSFPVTEAESPAVVAESRQTAPQLLLEERPALGTSAASHERRRPGRLRRGALMATTILMLGATGVFLAQWELQHQELAQPLALPALPAAPAPPVGSGAAPVIPPAEFFAPVTR